MVACVYLLVYPCMCVSIRESLHACIYACMPVLQNHTRRQDEIARVRQVDTTEQIALRLGRWEDANTCRFGNFLSISRLFECRSQSGRGRGIEGGGRHAAEERVSRVAGLLCINSVVYLISYYYVLFNGAE